MRQLAHTNIFRFGIMLYTGHCNLAFIIKMAENIIDL